MELEMTFHSVGNVIIPTDEVIFFRGVGEKPPTSIIRGMKSPCNHREIFTSQVYLENWFAHVHRPGPSESARERRLEARPLFRAAGSREVPNGGFPKWGYPQSSSIYRWIFHEINHPAIGVPIFMEPPKWANLRYQTWNPPTGWFMVDITN